VREDRGVDGRLRLRAHEPREIRTQALEPGVDEHETLVRLERRHAAELRDEPCAFGNLDRPAGEVETRVVGRFSETEPIPALRSVFDHGGSSSALRRRV